MSWDRVDLALARLQKSAPRHADAYLGFYSSWLGGYFREPWAMVLPLDDHGFHRGDAVFEAARIAGGALIAWDAHLERLVASARAIDLELPRTPGQISQICLDLARRAGAKEGVLRLYVTRGPGSFGPAPADSVGAQIFAAVTTLKAPSPESYRSGVRATVSRVGAKGARWARVKSCNYLQNVMMKRDAASRGFDYGLGVDRRGRVREGATENFVILDDSGRLLVPKFDYTLRGTTVGSLAALAKESGAREVAMVDLSLNDVRRAREAAFVGTTIGVLPIASLDEHRFPSTDTMRGLSDALARAWAADPSLRTEF